MLILIQCGIPRETNTFRATNSLYTTNLFFDKRFSKISALFFCFFQAHKIRMPRFSRGIPIYAAFFVYGAQISMITGRIIGLRLVVL